MPMKSEITDDVLIAIRRVIRAVDLHSRKLSQSYGLTGPQALVLKEIDSRVRISAGERFALLMNAEEPDAAPLLSSGPPQVTPEAINDALEPPRQN